VAVSVLAPLSPFANPGELSIFLLFIYQPIFVAETGGTVNRLMSSACLNLSSTDDQEAMPV